MAGAYFLYNDILAAANAVPTLSHVNAGSSVSVSTLPLANLLDRRVAKVARVQRPNAAVDSTSVFTFPLASFGGDKRISAIAIVGFKLTATNGQDITTRARFTVDVYGTPSLIVHSSPQFGIIGTAGAVPAGAPSIVVYVFPTPVTATDKIVLSVTQPFPTSTGTEILDIGRVYAADGVAFSEGVDADWNMTMADSARVMRSRGQQIYAEAVPRYRVGQFRLPSVPESLAIGTVNQPNRPNLQLMGLQVGVSGEVLVVPRSDDALALGRLAIYGRFTRPVQVRHLSGELYSCDLEVEEGL
ncbi:MAG TPA: hypothetical protein VM555_02190 [Tahibacter sp.]|jgi:hypothetical protein|nr:hypothetical protein [Tahibacter sp.]